MTTVVLKRKRIQRERAVEVNLLSKEDYLSTRVAREAELHW